MNYKKATSIKWKEVSEVSPGDVINVIFPDNMGLSIPKVDGNTDYAEIMRQVDAGELTNDHGEFVEETEWKNIRAERDRLLVNSDWTQAADSSLSASKKTEWETYRQELRDIPADQSSKTTYADITWPTEPE